LTDSVVAKLERRPHVIRPPTDRRQVGAFGCLFPEGIPFQRRPDALYLAVIDACGSPPGRFLANERRDIDLEDAADGIQNREPVSA
jgi:hypothetical protein